MPGTNREADKRTSAKLAIIIMCSEYKDTFSGKGCFKGRPLRWVACML